MAKRNGTWIPEIKVYCKECGDWVKESDTEFVDIAEDIQGADILTFVCPFCNTVQKSRRYG